MTETRGEQRAETAKLNDDSDIIEAANEESAPGQEGREGGKLQADIATQAEQARATEPAAHESVTKGDHIGQGDGDSPPHPASHVVTERD